MSAKRYPENAAHVKASGRVLPLRPAESQEDVEVLVPRRLPRIPPGDYEAVSVAVRRYQAFTRFVLRLDLDVFDGKATGGRILARLPYYMRWPGKRPAPTSKLGRLLHVTGLEGKRGQRVALSVLTRKLFRVRVADAAHDSEGNSLPTEHTYSVVSEILERLA